MRIGPSKVRTSRVWGKRNLVKDSSSWTQGRALSSRQAEQKPRQTKTQASTALGGERFRKRVANECIRCHFRLAKARLAKRMRD